MGAIIDQGQLDTVKMYVQSAIDEGAEILTGGKELKPEGFENGFWYAPTIIGNVTHDMKVVQEEIFGPVVVVSKFKDEKEAIALANDSDFGLSFIYLVNKYGARATRVANQIQAGIVMINCHSLHSQVHHSVAINNPDLAVSYQSKHLIFTLKRKVSCRTLAVVH